MSNRLPIVSTFLEALSLPYKHFRQLLKVGTTLIILGFVYFTFSHFFPEFEPNLLTNTDPYNPESTDDDVSFSLKGTFFFIVKYLLFWIASAMAIIGCHRIILLDENSVSESNLVGWTGNEIAYVGWCIRIGICILPFVLLWMLLFVTYFSAYLDSIENPVLRFLTNSVIELPFLYLVSRWSLVLPSAAIGQHGRSLSWSWFLSLGNGWRLTLLIGFLPYVMSNLIALYPSHDSLLVTMIRGAIWLVIGVVQVGLLSLCYKFFVDNEPDIDLPGRHHAA